MRIHMFCDNVACVLYVSIPNVHPRAFVESFRAKDDTYQIPNMTVHMLQFGATSQMEKPH